MFSIFKRTAAKSTPVVIPSPRRETGASGLPEYYKGLPSVEFLSKLAPPYNIRTFRKMRYNDSIIGGILMEIELMLATMETSIEGPNAEFCTEVLKRMETSIPQIISDMSSAITYGFYIGEKVYGADGSLIYLKDVKPRFQETISAINNENGDVVQDTDTGQFKFSYKRALHHTFIADCRNPFGTSLLRHVYQPYYFKSVLTASEAATIDRDLTGLPVITTPEGFDFSAAMPDSTNYDAAAAATLEWATDLVTNVRTDSQQGIVLPFGFKFEIVRGENRSSIPTTDIINRFNNDIVSGLLSQFMMSTKMTDAKTQIDTFMRTIDAMALKMSWTLNLLLKDICQFNGKGEAPIFKFSKLRQESLTNMASFVARLVFNNVITPTTELEHSLLKLADLPIGDTKRPMTDKDSANLLSKIKPESEPAKKDEPTKEPTKKPAEEEE